MTARFIIGDSLTVLKTLPDASVDLVMTSPPFLALRSYLPEGHPDKAHEMGSEASPGDFIDALLDVIEECARILTPHGSICIELGDTYSGSGGSGGDYLTGGMRGGQQEFSQSKSKRKPNGERNRWGPRLQSSGDGWPLAKSLCLIPEIFRFALVYGFNPLTGRETPNWRARNVVRWVRPNPPVGALGDKFRPATSELVIACKGSKRFFDLDAVRIPTDSKGKEKKRNRVGEKRGQHGNWSTLGPYDSEQTNGAPPLDWWSIPPGGYPGAHYAVYPPDLCVRPIKAMCPERVCTECGAPSVRVVGSATYVRTDTDRVPARLAQSEGQRVAEGVNQHHMTEGANTSVSRQAETLGWTDCGHNSWRSGVVLDPFAGSGTTLAVATGHGRDAIGIDLDDRNAELAKQRVGMLLEVIDSRTTERSSTNEGV